MARQRPLTIEEVLAFPIVSDAQIQPAGEEIAYVRGELVCDKARLPKQHIWLMNADGKNDRQFSHGPCADFSPRWSPDGTRIAFLSDRLGDGKPQIFLIDRGGGEAVHIADLKGEINTSSGKDVLQWSPDGKHLAFTMIDPDTEDEKKRQDAKDDVIEFEKVHKYTRVWTVDLATHELKCVTRGEFQVWEFQWASDGQEFALIISDLPYEWSWYRSRLARVPASGGIPKTIYRPGKRQLALPRWSPDQKSIAFLSSVWSDRGLVQGGVFLAAVRGGHVRELASGYSGSFGWIAWINNGRALLTAGHEQGQGALGKIDIRTGRIKTLWREPVALAEPTWPCFTISVGSRCVAIVRHGPKEARNVWRVDLGNQTKESIVRWTCLTNAVPNLHEFALGVQEMTSWSSRDGLVIHGILIKPVGYMNGRRYPMIVSPHGGPTSMVGNGFNAAVFFWGQLLAGRGYVVFLPNFRGSSGFGLSFAEANVGDMGGMDFHDIETGVDALIARGIADPKRLGIGGWSYGGFMACWTVTQTNRYKAAVMGAGISNWHSFHGNSNIHTWDTNHYDAHPYERDGPFAKFSAINYIHRVKTPMLILHPEKDLCVPAEQGYQFYRALRDHGIDSELVIYPREGHAILERPHYVDRYSRIARWFDKYLRIR